MAKRQSSCYSELLVPCGIDQQRQSGNKQPGSEWKCACATLAQTSDVHVQAILMKLAAAGSLLSGEDEGEEEEELDPTPSSSLGDAQQAMTYW